MTADLSTLTDDALNERLLEAMGFVHYTLADMPEQYREYGIERRREVGLFADQEVWADPAGPNYYCNICGTVPAFATSVDALLAPGGPIERCRERGYAPRIDGPWGADGLWHACLIDGEGDGWFTTGSHPARALAEAACAALEATE